MKFQKWQMKTLGLVCAAVSALGLSACNINVGKTPDVETLYFQRVENKDEYAVVGIGTFTGADLVIPETFKGLPVTEIAPRAFKDCVTISSISIPSTVHTIGISAFEGLDAITSVTIPEQVTHISASTFKGCSELETLILPSGLQEIDYWAFDGCDKLTRVYYHGDASAWESVKVQLNNTPIEEASVYKYSENEPEQHGGYWHYVGKDITVWETMRHMWTYSSTVEPTCSSVGYTVMTCHFCGDEEKTNVTDMIPHTWIDSVVAPQCEEQGYDLKTCEVCGEEEKSNFTDALEHVWGDAETIAPTCTEQGYDERICDRCEGSEKTNIVNKLGHGAMKDGNCGVCGEQLASEGLAYTVSTNRKYAIVTGYTGTDDIVCISDTYMGLPVTHIGASAFAGNTTVKGFKTLSGIQSIGAGAFENCTNINLIIIPASMTEIGAKAFSGCTKLTMFMVANGSEHYQAIDGHLFTKDGTTLVQYAHGNTATSYTVPASVTKIGAYAFASNTKLTSVTMQDGVTEIGEHAFEKCSALTSVTLGEGLLKIQASAFAWCKKLSTINFPNSLQEIGAWAFSDCSSLKEVTLVAVTTIADYAFFNCTGLSKLKLSTTLTSIGKQAFSWCRGLLEVVIPNAVTTMGSQVFAWCPGLQIMCEASQAGEGWATDWNQDETPVIWNYQRD